MKAREASGGSRLLAMRWIRQSSAGECWQLRQISLLERPAFRGGSMKAAESSLNVPAAAACLLKTGEYAILLPTCILARKDVAVRRSRLSSSSVATPAPASAHLCRSLCPCCLSCALRVWAVGERIISTDIPPPTVPTRRPANFLIATFSNNLSRPSSPSHLVRLRAQSTHAHRPRRVL